MRKLKHGSDHHNLAAVLGAAVLVLSGAAHAVDMVPYPGTQQPMAVPNAVPQLSTMIFPQNGWDAGLLKTYQAQPVPAYFKPGQFDAVVPPPPPNDSPETRIELDALLARQDNDRKPDMVRLVNSENDVAGPITAFTVDGLIEPYKRPKTKKLIDAVSATVGYYVMSYKLKYQRALPSQLEPRLSTMFVPPRTASYPSDYAALGQAYALILGKLDPSNQANYVQRAMDLSLHREIAGVQYPSDGTAGRKLAKAVVEAMLEVPQFQDMFNEAQVEYAGIWK
jgi:hypothetical protein